MQNRKAILIMFYKVILKLKQRFVKDTTRDAHEKISLKVIFSIENISSFYIVMCDIDTN